MATLEDGPYQIRFVPAPEGMYATGTNKGDDVKVEVPSTNPQIWQIKRMDNTNYIIATMEGEFRVAWSLANPIRSYSSQSSVSVLKNICLENPGATFALNPKDGEFTKDAVYSISVSSGSSAFSNVVVTVIDQMVMAQESVIQDIHYIWQFVPVPSK